MSFTADMIDMLNALDWDKKNYRFNRNEKDMHPYSVINKDKETIITHNVLGINKEDLKISLNKIDGQNLLIIEGKSIDEFTEKEYSIHSTFSVDESALDLTKITTSMKNGLLYIRIPMIEKKKKNTSIKINIA